jgi:hypothetical protein
MSDSVELLAQREAWRVTGGLSKSALTILLVFGSMSAAASPGDLSKYRNFQLGTDLATVAEQAGESPNKAKVIEQRPALIQELDWRPERFGSSSQPEAVKDTVFSFCDGRLFQITVNYDRYKIEGLTADDIADTISAIYGVATHPAPAKAAQGSYAVPEDVVARWEDSQYRLDLFRALYEPGFKLVVTAKSLESTVQAALLEGKRLDDKEAPQREAARAADEQQAERARLEKARLANKPAFRP